MLAVAVVSPTGNPCTDVHKTQPRLRPPTDTGGIISMCGRGLKSRCFNTTVWVLNTISNVVEPGPSEALMLTC